MLPSRFKPALKRRKTRVAEPSHAGDFIHGRVSASGHFRERVPTITVRPDEESRSGGLAGFKWSSLRIGSGNGNRSDAKGIIVGSHDRQRERRLIKALKLTGRRRFAPASRRFLFQELTQARRSRPRP